MSLQWKNRRTNSSVACRSVASVYKPRPYGVPDRPVRANQCPTEAGTLRRARPLRRGRSTQLTTGIRVSMTGVGSNDPVRTTDAGRAFRLQPLRFREDLATLVGAQCGVILRVIFARVWEMPHASVWTDEFPGDRGAARWTADWRQLCFVLHVTLTARTIPTRFARPVGFAAIQHLEGGP